MQRIPQFSKTLLVSADKASNNVLIVCKKYYLDVVLKELDTCSGTSPQTYTPCSTHVENLVAEHEDFMDKILEFQQTTSVLLAPKNVQKPNRK